MGSIIKKKSRQFPVARYIAQFGALAFLMLPFLNIQTVCAPVFFCHGCPLSTMACPIGVLVNLTTLRIFPFITLGILGAVGTIGGRLVCGWICPFGLLQDLLHKIPTAKIKLWPKLGYLKYAILAIMVFAIPFFFPGKPHTFCHYCPSGTLEASLPWEFMGVKSAGGPIAHAIRIGILIFVALLAVVSSRSWCRVFCPLGAIFSVFNRISLFRFRQVRETCKDCGVCGRHCPVEIDPVKQMNTAECIRCMDCTTTDHIKLGTK